MATARLGDAMAALVTAFQASPSLTGVTVTFGNVPSAAGDPEFIVVGHDGTLEADGSLAEVTESGQFATTFITLGSPPVTEEAGQVNVVAVAQTGDTADLAGRVTEVQRILSACDDACTDLKVNGIVFDNADTGRLIIRQAAQGCAAEISFTVSYTVPW